MIKKCSAFLVSAVMCMTSALSSCTLQTDKKEAISDENQSLTNSDYKLSATNSLGYYITNSVDQFNNNLSQLSNKTNNTVFAITSLEFDIETGTVQIATTQSENAKIMVSFVNDETSENVFNVETTVEAGQLVNSQIKADISKLPQYFIVKAQLFDKMNHPVGKEYKLSRYTKNTLN